jgi:hypothetical protein
VVSAYGRSVRAAIRRFWDWYDRHYVVNVAVALGLFALQLVHLSWLSADVVAERLTGRGWFPVEGPLRLLVVAVDYTEIPALLGVGLIYVRRLRDGFAWRPLLLLLLLNSQWLHLFWITDEFVLAALPGPPRAGALPAWLAWVAIVIDYLELPVMWDTATTFTRSLRAGQGPRSPAAARAGRAARHSAGR